MATPSQIDVECPLCGVRKRLDQIGQHGRRAHSEKSENEFQALLLRAFETGELKYDTKRVPRSKDMHPATAALRQHIYGGNAAMPFNGGAFELGKRK